MHKQKVIDIQKEIEIRLRRIDRVKSEVEELKEDLDLYCGELCWCCEGTGEAELTLCEIRNPNYPNICDNFTKKELH